MTKDSPRTSVLRDAELIARLRDAPADGLGTENLCLEAADRIEALTAELATCEKYRDAYAECDRIGTQAVRDLEVKLAEGEARLGKAVEALEDVHRFGVITHPARATLAEIKLQSSEFATQKGESHE